MLGAAFGGVTRYALNIAITERFAVRFPLGTLVINVTGCFVIGILMTLFTERLNPHPNWQPFLVVGILGGYTTFSSFGWETYQQVRQGHPMTGLAYVLLSVILGYIAVWCGAALVRK